jgi:epoxyqueuosine reductase QueG
MQYDGINLYTQMIATMLGCLLTDRGYNVVTFPPSGGSGISGRYMVKEMYNFGFHQWSHRHSAVACGLGELGMNSGFICPEYGLRVRLCSVITDAHLKADPLDNIGQTCLGSDCDLCVKACPDPKPHGEIYRYELIPGYEIVTRTMDFRKCGGVDCGKCMSVCPVGR